MSELLDEIRNNLMLSVMMGIPYEEARQWMPGDMPSWVQKRFLERERTTALELEQAKKWRRETLYWIDSKLAEMTQRHNALMNQRSTILRMHDAPDLEDIIFALKQFQIRLANLSKFKQVVKKKKDGTVESSYMIEVFDDSRLVEEYRAR